jgi:hypothetical protein
VRFEVDRNVAFHNLDAIISVGYRVNSVQATQFRQGPTGLATSVIMENALVGLCGPLTKLLGYVMKIPQKKKYFKPPVVRKVKVEPETDEYPTQLALGF